MKFNCGRARELEMAGGRWKETKCFGEEARGPAGDLIESEIV